MLIPIVLNFSKLSHHEQAKAILAEVSRLHQIGYSKVGITYSANYAQSENIHHCYQTKKWITGTSGANQAEVISEIEGLLQTKEYQKFQGIFHILPITTMLLTHEPSQSHKVGLPDEIVKKDQDFILNFIKEGGVVLGWQNQLSTEEKPFAVGGGIARMLPDNMKLSESQTLEIQQFLNGIQK